MQVKLKNGSLKVTTLDKESAVLSMLRARNIEERIIPSTKLKNVQSLSNSIILTTKREQSDVFKKYENRIGWRTIWKAFQIIHASILLVVSLLDSIKAVSLGENYL